MRVFTNCLEFWSPQISLWILSSSFLNFTLEHSIIQKQVIYSFSTKILVSKTVFILNFWSDSFAFMLPYLVICRTRKESFANMNTFEHHKTTNFGTTLFPVLYAPSSSSISLLVFGHWKSAILSSHACWTCLPLTSYLTTILRHSSALFCASVRFRITVCGSHSVNAPLNSANKTLLRDGTPQPSRHCSGSW